MIEFSHVLCGSFRLTESQRLPRRIVTVLNGGLILGEEDESEPGGMWRCQLVPDAFAAATKGGLPGQGSAANYSFDREQYKREITDGNGSTVLPLHDICVWPGSEAACTLMEKLVDHGLVLRDAPLECKSCFVESFLKALPEDEERVQLFDPKSQSPLHFKAFHNEGWEVKAENGVLRVHHYDNPEAELWMGKDFVVHTSAKDAINGFQRIGFIIEKDKVDQTYLTAQFTFSHACSDDAESFCHSQYKRFQKQRLVLNWTRGASSMSLRTVTPGARSKKMRLSLKLIDTIPKLCKCLTKTQMGTCERDL